MLLPVQYNMKRTAVGIWKCKACKKVQAGGAYTLKCVAGLCIWLPWQSATMCSCAVLGVAACAGRACAGAWLLACLLPRCTCCLALTVHICKSESQVFCLFALQHWRVGDGAVYHPSSA